MNHEAIVPLLGFVASCFSDFSNGAITGKYRRWSFPCPRPRLAGAGVPAPCGQRMADDLGRHFHGDALQGSIVLIPAQRMP